MSLATVPICCTDWCVILPSLATIVTIMDISSYEKLHELAHSPYVADRIACARKAHQTSDLLHILSKDSDPLVVWSVAENPQTSTETLTEIVFPSPAVNSIQFWRSKDSHSRLSIEETTALETVFRHTNLDPKVVNKVVEQTLANPTEKAVNVLSLVKTLTTKQINAIWNSPGLNNNKTIVFLLLSLKNTPEDILGDIGTEALKFKKNLLFYNDIKNLLPQHPSTPSYLLTHMWEEAEQRNRQFVSGYHAEHKIISNPNTHPDLLRLMYKNSDYRTDLAHNPNLPEDLTWMLAADPSWEVRARVAANLHVSSAVINLLAYDSDPTVEDLAVSNPRLDNVEKMLEVVESSNISLQNSLLRNKNLSDELLAQLVNVLDAHQEGDISYTVGTVLKYHAARSQLVSVFANAWFAKNVLSFQQVNDLLESGAVLSQQNLLTFVELYGSDAIDSVRKSNIHLVNPLLIQIVQRQSRKFKPVKVSENSYERDRNGYLPGQLNL